ncbi:PAS domain S-box protein [Lacinutrix sp. MEBiC02595]
MNIYTIILIEFLLISASILLLFKFRNVLGLAPLYLFLGAVRYLQALSGTMISFTVFDELVIYPTSVIIFSSLLFAVLLIYIKEGVSSARALILGILISNLLLSALFAVANVQNLGDMESSFAFLIDDTYFITGTVLLLLDFLWLVIIYQFLISVINKQYFFFTLFISLLAVFVFDAFIFNITLYFGDAKFYNLLAGSIIGKFFAALLFSVILYIYIRYIDNEKSKTSFIANQEREVFSILRYEKKYLKLKAEKNQLKESLTSQLETSLNSISGGFISLDTNWCYTYVNKKAAELLGRKPGTLVGKHIWTEFPEGVDRSFYKAYYKAMETQKTVYFDDYYEPLDKWFENRIYPSPEGLTIYYTDITEKKKTDANNQMLLSLIETNDDFIGLASLEGEPLYLNDNGRQLIGLASDEKMPASISDFFPEDYRDRITNEHMSSIFETNRWCGETYFKHFKTGNLIPIEMSGFLIKDKVTGTSTALGIVAKDITKRKEAEEKLIYSEQLFRRLTSKAPTGIYQTDREGSCDYVNERWLEYAGISYEDAMGYGWATAIHPDDEVRIRKEWEAYVVSGASELETDFRFLHKDDKVIWVSVKTIGTYDAQNNLYGYIGMAIDVTESKEAEEKLINSEQLFRRLSSNAPVGIFETDKNGVCNYVNEEWIKYSGLTFNESIGLGWSNAIHPEDRDRVVREWEQAVSSKTELVSDFRLLNKKGGIKWISAKTTSLYDSNTELYGYIGTLVDVTERKEAEEQIIQSEKYLYNIINSIGDPIFVKDGESRFVLANEAFYNLFNFSKAEIIGKTLEESLPMDEMKGFLSIDKEVLSTGIENISEEILTLDGGDIRIVSTKKTRYIDVAGDKYLIGVFRDITELRKTDEEIRKAHQRLTTHLNNSPLAIVEFNTDFFITNWSVQAENIFGWKASEVIGKQLADLNLVYEEDLPSTDFIASELRSGKVKNNRIVNRNNTKSGKVIYCQWYNSVLQSPDGEVETVLALIQDVTESKKADEENRKAHQRLTSHLNNSPLAIIEWDKNLVICRWSPQAENIFGWKEHEVVGKHFGDFNLVYEEDYASTEIVSSELRNGKVRSNKIINRNNTKSGKVIYCQWYNSLLKSPDGEVETVLSLVQDITEHIEAEDNVKEIAEKFSKAFDSNVIGKAILNKEKTIVEVNEALANIVGFEREEMLGNTAEEIGLFNFDNQKNVENQNKLWGEFDEKGYVSNIELEYQMQSGKELFLLISLQSLQLNNEGHVLITIIDITEKKNIEEELAKHRNNLEELIKVRTEEIYLKNNQLERMNKLFVGRELKMKELKNAIKDLQSKMDN